MEERKERHLELAPGARTPKGRRDPRFHYEPLLAAHPGEGASWEVPFLGKTLGAPLWVSSMTGGARGAGRINRDLASVCAEFRLGMGLGSCRPLLEEGGGRHLADFDVRPVLGDGLPLYANLGVAQVEGLARRRELGRAADLVGGLRACGLIVHVNPMQEWFQPEGDRFGRPPLETVQELLEETRLRVIVKEVGQGMGPGSIAALMRLPLAAIEFGAFGGTNFSEVERRRDPGGPKGGGLALVGHTAQEMVSWANGVLEGGGPPAACRDFIISGGIADALEGLSLMRACRGRSVFAMAGAFLEARARGPGGLRSFARALLGELAMARAFLADPADAGGDGGAAGSPPA